MKRRWIKAVKCPYIERTFIIFELSFEQLLFGLKWGRVANMFGTYQVLLHVGPLTIILVWIYKRMN